MAEPQGITKRTNAFFVDPKAIKRREGWNPRFDFGDMAELKKSIKTNGVLNPLRLKRGEPGEFILVDGDRRFTAIEELLKEKHKFPDGVPAILLSKDHSDIDSLVQMFEANTGKPFLPLEEAAAFQKMRDAGMTIKQICEKVSRSHVHVESTLALLVADDSVKEAVKKGEISGTLGKQIAVKGKGDKKMQQAAVAKAKTGKEGKAVVKRELSKVERRKPSANKPKSVQPLTKVELQTLETKLLAHLKEQSKNEILSTKADKVRQTKEGASVFLRGILAGIQIAQGIDMPLDDLLK